MVILLKGELEVDLSAIPWVNHVTHVRVYLFPDHRPDPHALKFAYVHNLWECKIATTMDFQLSCATLLNPQDE